MTLQNNLANYSFLSLLGSMIFYWIGTFFNQTENVYFSAKAPYSPPASSPLSVGISPALLPAADQGKEETGKGREGATNQGESKEEGLQKLSYGGKEKFDNESSNNGLSLFSLKSFLSILNKGGSLARYGMILSNILLALLLIVRWKESGHFPLSNLYESLMFLSWCFTGLHIFIENYVSFPSFSSFRNNNLSPFPGEERRTALSPLFRRKALSFPLTSADKKAQVRERRGEERTPKERSAAALLASPYGSAEGLVAFLSPKKKKFIELFGAITTPSALLTNAFATFTLPKEMQEAAPLVPALQSNWLMMHVTVMILSYAALILGSLLSIAFLIVTSGSLLLSPSLLTPKATPLLAFVPLPKGGEARRERDKSEKGAALRERSEKGVFPSACSSAPSAPALAAPFPSRFSLSPALPPFSLPAYLSAAEGESEARRGYPKGWRPSLCPSSEKGEREKEIGRDVGEAAKGKAARGEAAKGGYSLPFSLLPTRFSLLPSGAKREGEGRPSGEREGLLASLPSPPFVLASPEGRSPASARRAEGQLRTKEGLQPFGQKQEGRERESYPPLLPEGLRGCSPSRFAPSLPQGEATAKAGAGSRSEKVWREGEGGAKRREQKQREEIAIILDNLSYRILGIGFPFLTIGILSGAVWANEAWGSYWSWDPKETWALLTWLVFAIYLHTRLSKGWEGRKPAIIASFGLVIVWMCYLGVNLIGEGLHSYGWIVKS